MGFGWKQAQVLKNNQFCLFCFNKSDPQGTPQWGEDSGNIYPKKKLGDHMLQSLHFTSEKAGSDVKSMPTSTCSYLKLKLCAVLRQSATWLLS